MRRLLALVAIAAAVAGCTHHIGDSCTQNVDCSPLGDRFCDTSAPGGYCTIQDCDVREDPQGNLVDSCTDADGNSVCVRFFTQVASEPCDPIRELQMQQSRDRGDANACLECTPDEACHCDASDPANPTACVASSATSDGGVPDGGASNLGGAGITGQRCPGAGPYFGHCAPILSERRWCQKLCSTDGDCRLGYHCVSTGGSGAEPVPRREVQTDGGLTIPVGDPAMFCVPSGTPMPM